MPWLSGSRSVDASWWQASTKASHIRVPCSRASLPVVRAVDDAAVTDPIGGHPAAGPGIAGHRCAQRHHPLLEPGGVLHRGAPLDRTPADAVVGEGEVAA